MIKKILEVKKLISSWSRRLLTTMGKVTVVKSILLPKFTHLFITLPDPTTDTINEIERLFFNYIWHNKKDRVSRKTLIQDYKDGGIRMTHIPSFVKALKLTWIRRLLTSKTTSWMTLLYSTLSTSTSMIFQFW